MILSIILILLIILTIVLSFYVNIFLRLKKAYKQYYSDSQFSQACNLSKDLVNYGLILTILILCISLILVIITSIQISR